MYKEKKEEPVVLTLVEHLSRYAISLKLMNAKSETVQKGLFATVKEAPEVFNSITFDNDSEFSQAVSPEDEDELDIKIYFCHAYSA